MGQRGERGILHAQSTRKQREAKFVHSLGPKISPSIPSPTRKTVATPHGKAQTPDNTHKASLSWRPAWHGCPDSMDGEKMSACHCFSVAGGDPRCDGSHSSSPVAMAFVVAFWCNEGHNVPVSPCCPSPIDPESGAAWQN
jgi:hypothetical protein